MSRYLKLQVRAQQSFAPRTVVLNVLIAVTYSVTELSREGPCASPDVADTRTVRPSCPVDVGETKQSFKHPAAWDLDGTEWEVEDFCGRDAGGHPGPTHGERPNSQGQHSDVPHVEGQVGLGHGWRAAGGSLGHTQTHIFKRQAPLLKDELPVCVCGGGGTRDRRVLLPVTLGAEAWTHQGSDPGGCRGPRTAPHKELAGWLWWSVWEEDEGQACTGHLCPSNQGSRLSPEAEHLATCSLSPSGALPCESREQRAERRLGWITCEP